MSLTYLYDGTESGFFTAVFTAYEKKQSPDRFLRFGAQTMLLDEISTIGTDAEKGARVEKKLLSLGGSVLKDVKTVLRSPEENAPLLAFRYIKKCLRYGKHAIERQSDEDVFAFCSLLQEIGLEIHRFTGFLRFEESKEGYFYAHFEPDNDIVDLLLPHFTARFSGIPFVIHDVRRNRLAFYNGKRTCVLQGTGKISVTLSDSERDFQDLWRAYYDAVTIKERKNERQMRGFMPVRYYKHLPEKTDRRK